MMDLGMFFFAADDVFVIISVPGIDSKMLTVNFPSDGCLVGSDDGGNGTWNRFLKLFGRVTTCKE
jgi:hypothetical protein